MGSIGNEGEGVKQGMALFARVRQIHKKSTDFKEKIGYSYRADQPVLKEPYLWTL